MAEPRVTLAILAKAPVPGYAKTRLAPRLGAEGAAALQAVLLDRTVRAAEAAGFARVVVWCAPDARAPELAALRGRAGLVLRDQPGGGLGERLLAAFEADLPDGPVVAIGTDAPALGAGHLARAAAALAEGAPAVLTPAEDGGYALLGLARVDPSLFQGVPWSTAEVLAATRARLAALGWAPRELPAVRDVDLPADLDWLLESGLLDGEERARLSPWLP